MRLLLAESRPLFSRAPSPERARLLARALERAGHSADRLWLPVAPVGSEASIESLVFRRFLDLDGIDGQSIDGILALDLPAALLRHPRRVSWATAPTLGEKPAPEAEIDWRRLGDFVGAEVVASFATSGSAARALGLLLGRDVEVLEVPASDDAEGWRHAAERLLAPIGRLTT